MICRTERGGFALWVPSQMPIANLAGDRGRIVLLLVLWRLSLDVYVWPTRRWQVWRRPEVGVRLDVRLGRVECQWRRVPPGADR